MGALTPQYLMDLESRMETITESEYQAGLLSNLWWDKISKVRTVGGRREVLMWLISTAQIRSTGKDGGNLDFEDLVSQTTEMEVESAGAGLKLSRFQLEDTDGQGLELAAAWSGDIGTYMSYWPQKLAADVLKNGHTAKYTAYDKQVFFSNAHPVNPGIAAVGSYSNIFTAGSGPGALPIDDSVSLEVAYQNLTKAWAYIQSIPMPNGVDPRGLEPAGILCGPRLYPRALQLSMAKFIPSVVGSGAGVADIAGVVQALNFGAPILARELAGFESDTTYFIVAKQAQTRQLGALVYLQREPFHVNYFGELSSAELSRKDELEWHCKGRNSMTVGHPYCLFKAKAT